MDPGGGTGGGTICEPEGGGLPGVAALVESGVLPTLAGCDVPLCWHALNTKSATSMSGLHHARPVP